VNDTSNAVPLDGAVQPDREAGKSTADEGRETSAPRPRRRGHRGGRRRSKTAAQPGGAEPPAAQQADREAAGAGGPGQGAETPAAHANGGEGHDVAAEPSASEQNHAQGTEQGLPTPPRRRRRGGRHKAAAAQKAEPASERNADLAALSVESPPGEPERQEAVAPMGGELSAPAAAAVPRRRRRGARGSGSRQAQNAASSADGAQPTAVGKTTEPASSPGEIGAESPSPQSAPATREVVEERPDEEAEATDVGVPATKRPRRRRSGRKGSQTAATAVAVAETAGAPIKAAADEVSTPAAPAGAAERRPRRRQGRREAAPAERAGAERVIVASGDYGELRVALLEDGRLAEVYFQRPERPSYLGNIYRAKVESVLRGMDAAFVDFGLEKNGFLHVDEVSLPENGSRRGKRITQLLQAGQELLVQVTKDPMGSKGARLTTRMSLAGRYVVYVPGGSGVGVSRRLAQQERDRLRDICRELKAKDAGVIVRTVAEGKGLEELRRDLQYLARLWARIRGKAEKTPAPGLVHEEVDISLAVARDLFDESVTRFVVDSAKLRKALLAYLGRVAPELVDRVELYQGEEALFDEYGIEEQLERTLARRVPLPSGGNIMIDHAEALTVIDVNSGRYTGGSGLEDTITRTNLEAATEVVRQLRLRDIGGIIVIDFIDMERTENRSAVLARLEAELATDRTKTYVVEISPLGLVEMTRQNTTDGARGILTRACATCSSTGRVLSEDTIVRRVERRLRMTAASSRAAALLIEVNGSVGARLQENERIRKLERETGKRFLFQGSRTLPTDSFEIVAQGTVPQMEAQRLPVVEGAELELELEHSLIYSPKDALALVHGYPLVVKGGRQHLGLRRRVRVETTLRTGGTAVIVGPAGPG